MSMALQPSLRSLAVIGHPNAVHTMDVFCESFENWTQFNVLTTLPSGLCLPLQV